MNLSVVAIQKPETLNFILGQSHFIKTVEDVHEALVNAVPGIKFGLAFCEASGACLIRWTGTDEALIRLAIQNAQALSGALVHRDPGQGLPINVLKPCNGCPKWCASSARRNSTEVIIARRTWAGHSRRHRRLGQPGRRR